MDDAQCLLNNGPRPTVVFIQHGATRMVLQQTIYDQLVTEAAG